MYDVLNENKAFDIREGRLDLEIKPLDCILLIEVVS